jgi:serine/threonine-protein kinase
MDDLAGRALGPYQLVERIGIGGMAAVYRGVHVALGQPRAIKILLPAHAEDASLVERFRVEAQIASGLRHPNIVSIYDVGEQDGLFYLVMDLVEGTSLGRLLRRESPLELGRATQMLSQLASALDYAHGAGVVHRDVKPGNVVVGTDDHVSLLDFGVARIGGVLHRLTNPGQLVGTPEYLAPEVITGAEGDRRSDYYGLGVLAFQMLAGKLPFSGRDTMALLYAHVSSPPPSLRETRPELPVAVDRVVARQLSKTPEARYPTATGFVQALVEAAGAAQPAGPPPPGAGLAEPATPAPGFGLGDAAQRPRPDATDAGFTTLPAAFLSDTEDIATPHPRPLPSTFEQRSDPAAPDRHAVPTGFDQRAATIPPPSYDRSGPSTPAPGPRPKGGPQPVARGPEERADLVLQPRAHLRRADSGSQGNRSLGPAVVAMAVVGLIVWALATGRFWTLVGLDPTPLPLAEPAIAPPARGATATPRPTVDTTGTGVAVASSVAVPISASPAPAGAPPAADASPAADSQAAAASGGAGQPHGAAPPAARAAPPPAPPPSPEQQLRAGGAQIDSGEYAQAVAALRSLRASAPDTEGVDDALYRALLGLGQQQREQGLLDDSYATYGEALTLRTDDPAALDGQKQVVLAKLWGTMEVAWDQDEAVASAALEEIMSLDPGYRDANQKLYALLVTRANRLIEAGDVDGALVALRRAQDVYPEGDEARLLIVEHTPRPTPTTAPAQQAPAPASKPAPQPAPKPASRPEPKPELPITLPQAPSNLPSLPKPGGLPGLPIP